VSEETWRDTILFKRKLHICIYHSKNEKIEEGKVTADWDPSGDKPKLSDNRKKYGEWTGKDRELYNALGMELPVLLEKMNCRRYVPAVFALVVVRANWNTTGS